MKKSKMYYEASKCANSLFVKSNYKCDKAFKLYLSFVTKMINV
jgi:hypothetical protein